MSTLTTWLSLAAALAIAGACLPGLAWWARGSDTRALHDDHAGHADHTDHARLPPSAAPLPLRLAGVVALQAACGWTALGPAAGLFTVAAAWMLAGWLFVLALNARPQGTLKLAMAMGVPALAACAAMAVGMPLP